MTALLRSAGSAQSAAQPAVVERQSGVSFPVVLTPPGGAVSHRLMGTATRERTIFKVKVYAYGLYVDPEAARAHLTSFAGRPVSALDRDPAFFRRLLDSSIPMSLRLVTTRDVAGAALGEAFDDALKPRVVRAATELKMPGGQAPLDRFRGYFNLREVVQGTEIVFSCEVGGRLRTMVSAQPRPEIESPALCWALFDVYLGDKPISADGRRSLVAGFPALLAGSR